MKDQIVAYWDRAACGSDTAKATKFSREYFEQIEAFRYRHEPEIFPFAQFTRHHGQRVLEVGVGAGTDFLQWVRAGARAHGVDISSEAIAHVTERLAAYGMTAEDLRLADAGQLPYNDGAFDLVYSWGVIHHTPDPFEALREIVRCTRPGGRIKVMVYNRRSLFAFYHYLRFGLLRGKPFHSVSRLLRDHLESPGTQAFTAAEVRAAVADLPVDIVTLSSPATAFYDLLRTRHPLLRIPAYLLACACGQRRCGWFLMVELRKASPGAVENAVGCP